jgi:hypothetical protein
MTHLWAGEARNCVPVQPTLAVQVQATFAQQRVEHAAVRRTVRHVLKGTAFQAGDRETATSHSG